MKNLTLLLFLMLATKSFANDTSNKIVMWCMDSEYETAANFMMDPVRPILDKNGNPMWKKHYSSTHFSVTAQIKVKRLNNQFSKIESSIEIYENGSEIVLAETANTQVLETASLIAFYDHDKETYSWVIADDPIISIVTSTPTIPLTTSEMEWSDEIAEKYNFLKISCRLEAATDFLWNSQFTLESDR